VLQREVADPIALELLKGTYQQGDTITVDTRPDGGLVFDHVVTADFVAPIKAGIFPLVKKDGMPEMAHKIADDLRNAFPVFYDDSGAIGRRYRRQDEIGTPFCITVDGESTSGDTVTVRDRDSLLQERVATDQLRAYIGQRITE